MTQAAEFFTQEIDLECLRQRLAIPIVTAQNLLIVGPLSAAVQQNVTRSCLLLQSGNPIALFGQRLLRLSAGIRLLKHQGFDIAQNCCRIERLVRIDLPHPALFVYQKHF
jgi:hypothetical protein